MPTMERPLPRTNGAIVWDLDQTLVHSSSDMGAYTRLQLYSNPDNMDIRGRVVKFDFIFEGEPHTFWTIFRPGAFEAMKFSFEHFRHVIVWSAGVDPYVEQIVKYLFNGLPQPDRWFGRSSCVPKILPDGKILYTKPMQELCKMVPGVEMNSVTIIEDRAAVLATNIENGILISAYEIVYPTPTSIRNPDNELHKLMRWYKSIAYVRCRDVRLLPKNRIFVDELPPA